MKSRSVALLAAVALIVLCPRGAHAAPPSGPRLMSGWASEAVLSVGNNASVPLPSGYTVSITLNTAGLIAQGRMRSDCADLRILFVDGAVETELDRLVEGCNTAGTIVRYRTQAAIAVGSSDPRYRMDYGNPSGTFPPENPANVWAFYDDFQDGNDTGWTKKGTWAVVNDGGNYVYRYTSGGANWALASVALPDVSDLDYTAKIRGAASTNWIGLAFRIQNQSNFLTFYESKDVGKFKYARVVADNHTVPFEPPFPMTAGTWYRLRLQALGTTVRGRIWQDGTTEPTGWTISTTDTTYQAETNIGATLYNHATEADWDDVQVRRLVAVEPTVNITWGSAPWWNPAWGYRLPLAIDNTSVSAALPVRYSTKLTLDTSALIAAGEILPSCGDLRVLSFDGITSAEIDRVVMGCNTTQTEVWFALQRPIGLSGMDVGYYAYYGNPTAGAPLANGMNVFLFHEDFEQGTTHWTSAGGLDAGNTGTMGQSLISTEQSLSPSHSQKFPVKAGGGDAFSGYVPVTPSTGYAIQTWAKAASSTFFPVGFDPYDAARVKGAEVWLWTNAWSIPPQWADRSATFTTSANTAYIKIKTEWWAEAPGSDPVYMDDLFLRYWIASEPTVTTGAEETSLVAPEITNIHDTGPVEVHTPVDVFADVAAASGTVDTVTLKILSPVTADVAMSLVLGDGAEGAWTGSYTPSQGGTFAYRIQAHSTAGTSRLSGGQSFIATDSVGPVIVPVSVIDPILVKNTQTLVVQVTDNGVLGTVTVTTGGSTHPMTPQAGSLYGFSWQVTTVGTIAYTVTATDSANNTSTLAGSFESQARDVDVCTWKACKVGAASWSNDDASSTCRSNLEAAGFRGTYYANVGSTLSWFADYAAAGHEIGSHTVNHPCDSPCCTTACSPPNCPLTCTPTNIWECPFTTVEMTDFRTDQFEPNIAAIEAGTGVPVLSGAWPCGCTDARRMTAAQYYFLGVRGYNDCGCNWVQDVNEVTPTDFMNVNGLHAYDQTFIDRAINEGKWTVVTAHGGCTGIDYMGSRSDALWLAPVGEVLKYIKVRNAAQINNYSRTGRTIAFDAVHNLADFARQKVDGSHFLPIVFDNPVTLKVHILDLDQVLSVTVNDVPLAPTAYSVATLDGARFVLFDAPLKVASHVVVTLATPAPTIGAITDNSPVELGAAAQLTADVTITEGSVQSVTLHVLAPEPNDYPMTLVPATTTYGATFVPGQVASYSYQVVAANAEGTASQSSVRSLVVQDTAPPEWRNQAQDESRIPVGGTVIVSAQGRDLGGLKWAILATDESGSWQEFNWPISNWWNHAWAHRRPVTVTESAGLARTAETIDLAVSSDDFPGLASCVDELRVADAAGVERPSQVYGEQNVGGVATCRLLFQASVAASAGTTYYVYYGNPSATPPSYLTDLTSSTNATGVTVQSSFFDVFLDADSGVLSRVRLPQGRGTNLPLATESDRYWGWHQVCSGAGNLTGSNSQCFGGVTPASGLVPLTALDGPIVKELAYAIVRGTATYSIAYRFSAGAPSYRYTLGCAGTGCAAVMNNYWLMNGYYIELGDGAGGTPPSTYSTYDAGLDHLRIASFDPVDHTTIDGTDNDGTELGGTDYRQPTAASLSLTVATAASQAETEGVLARVAAPLVLAPGAVEDAPVGSYGSPADLGGASGWTPSAFAWSNPAVVNGTTVHWRIKYCDLQGNCASTPEASFLVQNAPLPTTLSIPDDATGGFDSDVWVSISAALPPLPDTPSVMGIDLAIQYDPAVLTPLEAVPSTAAAAAGFAIEFNPASPPGNIILLSEYSSDDPLPYPGGEIARIRFHAVGAVGSQSALAFTFARLNEVAVDPANRQDGRVTVTGSIGGRVLYYRDLAIEPSTKVVPAIVIRRTQDVTTEDAATGATGAYSFTNLVGTMSVTGIGKHEDPPWATARKNAITSTDASHASFAAVGSEQLSVNQFAAADVTGNGTVSALDASYIARFSAELVDHFPVSAPTSSDWKLLKCVPSYPGNCGAPIYTFEPLTQTEAGRDFYAILYGDVTGNWTATGSFAASRAAVPSEEDKASIRDRELADRYRRDGAPPVVERRPGMGATELSLLGWKSLRAGERAQLSVDLRNADGILGLDLVLKYDPSRLAVVGVQATGIGSALSVARADRDGTHRIAAYGYAALSGSGSILTITVEGLNNKGRQLPPTIGGVANEGAIPLRVQQRSGAPRGPR